MIHALLRSKGLTRNVSVPIFARLLTDTGSYFPALTHYRNGATAGGRQCLAGAVVLAGRALLALGLAAATHRRRTA